LIISYHIKLIMEAYTVLVGLFGLGVGVAITTIGLGIIGWCVYYSTVKY